MMRDAEQVLALTKKFIRKEMNDYADHLAGGACPNWENYQKITGVIQGLALVERCILDLAKEDDEEDDTSNGSTATN